MNHTHHGIDTCEQTASRAGLLFKRAETARQKALRAQGRGEDASDLWFEFREAVRRYEFADEEERQEKAERERAARARR